MTVVAEVAYLAGVFDLAAYWCARAGRGRIWLLWLLMVVLASACTIVLSLDTTAVLLTPVAIVLARRVRIAPVPLVMTTLWLANTASLLLPASNLTNLLAQRHFDGIGRYLSVMTLPAFAAIGATVVVLLCWHGRSLTGRYEGPPRPPAPDRTMRTIAGLVCVALGPVFVIGVTPAIATSIAAALLVVISARRMPGQWRRITVPWRTVIGVAVLFVVIDIAGRYGLSDVLGRAVGAGSDGTDLARMAAGAAVGSNVINNLPTYLALDPVAGAEPLRQAALLIGTNCGPLVTTWGSLATILWLDRCRRLGVRIRAGRLALQGISCAVAAVGAAFGALLLAG